jgi:hypothetical protein
MNPGEEDGKAIVAIEAIKESVVEEVVCIIKNVGTD